MTPSQVEPPPLDNDVCDRPFHEKSGELVPVTVQQVKKVHESNNRFRTAAEFAAARDALQVERLELEPRRSKAERAVAREERRRELQSSLRTTDRRRVMRLEQPRKKRTPGRNHPYAMRGRTSRKNHKPLTLAA